MSINKAHASGGGVVLFYGERLLIFYDGCEVQLKFDNQPHLATSSKGSIFLTTHRTICMCKSGKVLSMAMPLLNMKQVEVKQPIFGANRIEGKATPEPDGGYTGMAHFSVTFNRGGAIEFAQCLLEAGKRANANRHGFQAPPPYSAYDPSQLYCPPPAQYAADGPAYGFVPSHEAFAPPPPNYVYMCPAPPPYPGAGPPPPYPGQQPQYPGQQPQNPGQQPPYPTGNNSNGYQPQMQNVPSTGKEKVMKLVLLAASMLLCFAIPASTQSSDHRLLDILESMRRSNSKLSPFVQKQCDDERERILNVWKASMANLMATTCANDQYGIDLKASGRR